MNYQEYTSVKLPKPDKKLPKAANSKNDSIRVRQAFGSLSQAAVVATCASRLLCANLLKVRPFEWLSRARHCRRT